ncbi:unnamed protein product [Pleuronectes platessa]|uniref:Uncharacterized protein n=1 Tax=Pleuronectes platessa TaxID=8262 RepID=A0A9N7YXF5_PLEPL|nr:unnamed protein product [Pleuronectes platessa]
MFMVGDCVLKKFVVGAQFVSGTAGIFRHDLPFPSPSNCACVNLGLDSQNFNSLHVLAMLNVEKRGRTRRTSDMSAAASPLHQIQPDPLIDVRLTASVYAPDRILEWTFHYSMRHRQGPLVFSIERNREEIKT